MTWCKILQIYGLSFVQVASLVLKYAFGVTLFWTENCSSAESLIEFLDEPFTGGRNVHFSWHDLQFRPVCPKKVSRTRWRNCHKNKCHIGFPRLIYSPMKTHFLPLFDHLKILSWSSWGVYFIGAIQIACISSFIFIFIPIWMYTLLAELFLSTVM